jgi:hypothetical protein
MQAAAIRRVGSDTIELLVVLRTPRPNGSIPFYTVNGAWDGVLHHDGSVTVKRARGDDTVTGPSEIVWQGNTPAQFAGEYNAILRWVAEQIKLAEPATPT